MSTISNALNESLDIVASNKGDPIEVFSRGGPPPSKSPPIHCKPYINNNFELVNWDNETENPKKIHLVQENYNLWELFNLKQLLKVLLAQHGSPRLNHGLGLFRGVNDPYGVTTEAHWDGDVSFARQRLTGANPLAIERISDLSILKQKLDLFKKKDDDFTRVIEDCQDALSKSTKLFILDYSFLSNQCLPSNTYDGEVPATFSIFAYERTENNPFQLLPKWILLIRRNANTLQSQSTDRGWDFAKDVFNVPISTYMR